MPDYPQYLIDRFWSYVDKSPDPDGCWLWTRADDGRGYGVFTVPTGVKTPRKRNIRTHCFAYEVTYGPIPHGMMVLHKPPCQQKRCVRHVYAGTHEDNAADAVLLRQMKRGDAHHTRRYPETVARGERQGLTTLTDQDVQAIRAAFATGLVTQRALAHEYHLSPASLCRIVRRHAWKHLD